MNVEQWLEAHPYLRPIAELSGHVDRTVAAIEIPHARMPDWDDYRLDFLAGVPVLSSADAGVDLEPGGRVAAALVERLACATSTSPEWLAAETHALNADLRRAPEPSRRIADFLLGDDALATASPGLLRYLGWTAMARYLRPVVQAFGTWRDEDRWMRRYCPTCGSLPAMGQLAGTDPGRKRFLFCGCCGTRWQFARTGCPFCDTDSQRLASVAIEGEPSLRIDHCEACLGYLKTYNGEGAEALWLSDWSSLHLDVIAQNRGLKRMAASLYDLGSLIDGGTEEHGGCRTMRD